MNGIYLLTFMQPDSEPAIAHKLCCAEQFTCILLDSSPNPGRSAASPASELLQFPVSETQPQFPRLPDEEEPPNMSGLERNA